MSFDAATLTFTRGMRFETDSESEDGDAIEQDVIDRGVDDLVTGYNTAVSYLFSVSPFKLPVLAATTANITLSGAQTVDGVSLVAGDRVLVKDQTAGAANGIYVVATGAWTRSLDFDDTYVMQGCQVRVVGGAVGADKTFVLTTADPVIGTTSLTFTDVSTLAGFQSQADVLDDLATLGQVGNDGEFLVGTGAGAFAYESGATARTSLGDSGNVISRSSNYTPVVADRSKTIRCTAALTLSPEAAATLGNGWFIYIEADGGHVTFDPNASETIDGGLTKVVSDSMTVRVVCDGNSFYTDGVISKNMMTKGADVASSADLSPDNDGFYFDVTGTTTITSIDVSEDKFPIGAEITLQFDGALTLTHHATDLVLPSGRNITTAAGDHATFVKYAAGDWRCVDYTSKATDLNGQAWVAGDIAYHDGTNFVRLAKGSEGQNIQMNVGATAPEWSSGLYAHFRDQRTSGTGGDTRVASTWSKHTLQTEVLNNISGMTLTSSVISAPAGTYRVDASMGFDAGSLNDFVIRLRDTTNNVTLAFSAPASAAGAGDASVVPMWAVFTLAGATNIEVQYWQTSTGGWQATSNGDIEVGADILFQRVG